MPFIAPEELPGINTNHFSEGFFPVSYQSRGGRVEALELTIRADDSRNTYVMRLETYMNYAARVAEGPADTEEDTTFVVSDETITTDLLLDIKARSLSDLSAFLIWQS
jgi:hypothetical protein